jgi:hypothetical protein
MGKASSSKKIKRVQQAGASRAPGQRRNLGYPAVIAGVVLVGLVLTFFAVRHRRHVEEVRPTVEDNWVQAYGTFICDRFIDPFPTVQDDAPADLHADGLIHVHPTEEANAGEASVIGLYFQSAGVQVSDGSITLPDGTTYSDGDDCNGEPGRVALYVWPPQAGENTDPRVVTTNIGAQRFDQDAKSYVLAFAPRGAEVSLPPSTSRLRDPDDTEPEVVEPSSEATTTTAAPDGATDTTAPATTAPATTAPAETTTTEAGDG